MHKTGFRLLWLILKIKLPCHTFPAHILVLLSFATWRRIHVGDENRGSAAGLAGTTYILGTNQCTQYPGKRFVTFTISRVKTINVCLQQHLAARQTNESLHTWLGVIRTPLPNEKTMGSMSRVCLNLGMETKTFKTRYWTSTPKLKQMSSGKVKKHQNLIAFSIC